MELIFSLQRQASRNVNWAPSPLPARLGALFSAIASEGESKIRRVFWAIYGLRKTSYRLLDETGKVIASNRTDPELPFPTVVYAVKVWEESKALPGMFNARLNPQLSAALRDVDTDQMAETAMRILNAGKDSRGQDLSWQLGRIEPKSLSWHAIARSQ